MRQSKAVERCASTSNQDKMLDEYVWV